MNDLFKNILLWVVIAVVLMSVFNNFGQQQTQRQELPYDEFIADVNNGNVQSVFVDGRRVEGEMRGGESFVTFSPESDNTALVGDLLEHEVSIEAAPPESTSILTQIFISWFPFLLLIAVWIFFMRQMQGGGGGRGAMSFGKSK
ncbi:MAG: ATP-dependent metallopeptidase FtsH/Yme1/Tma family protein, partial [Halofilum sp. (in: g-proteobacteria)]